MWRKKVNKDIKPYLEKFIAETYRYKHNFTVADDPAKAQLWIAISLLAKQIHELEIKLNYLEGALRSIGENKKYARDINENTKQIIALEALKEEKIPVINLGSNNLEQEMKAIDDGNRLLKEVLTAKPIKPKQNRIKKIKIGDKKNGGKSKR